MLPESAYAKLLFPSNLTAFSAAVKNIVDSWSEMALNRRRGRPSLYARGAGFRPCAA